MKKLKIKIILMQLFGMIFLINGIFQLKIFSLSEKYECAFKYFEDSKSSCLNHFFSKAENVSEFISNVLLWRFLGLLTGIILISFLNWKYKISVLNTILTSIIIYSLFLLQFFITGITPKFFNSFGSLFSESFKTQFFIGGITFTIIGITTFWISVNSNLLTNKEKALN